MPTEKSKIQANENNATNYSLSEAAKVEILRKAGVKSNANGDGYTDNNCIAIVASVIDNGDFTKVLCTDIATGKKCDFNMSKAQTETFDIIHIKENNTLSVFSRQTIEGVTGYVTSDGNIEKDKATTVLMTSFRVADATSIRIAELQRTKLAENAMKVETANSDLSAMEIYAKAAGKSLAEFINEKVSFNR